MSVKHYSAGVNFSQNALIRIVWHYYSVQSNLSKTYFQIIDNSYFGVDVKQTTINADSNGLNHAGQGVPAIITEDTVVTYGELDSMVARRASELGADRFYRRAVAVSMPRSVDYVVTLLALLGNGAVFMPVAPDMPPLHKSRLNDIARPAAWIHANGELTEADIEPGLPLPEGSACIFFTSGSSGQPKAILGARHSLFNFINWQGECFQVGPQDRIAFTTGTGSEASLREIFLPLFHGATLVMPSAGCTASPERLLPFLQASSVTRIHLTPSVARAWARATDTPLPLVGTVFSAGEQLTGDTLFALRQLAPDAEIVNLYGPTETTQAKAFYRVPVGYCPAGFSAPVGRAIPGSAVSIAVDGEIIIETPDASFGYLGTCGAAWEGFQITDGVTRCRTGDLGFIDDEGLLVVTGRVDDKIGINGVRIDLQQVEHAIRAYGCVSEAIVVAIRSGRNNDLRLAAAWSGSGVSEQGLRWRLEDCLPSAAVPTLLKQLDSLPLNASGKVDAMAVAAMFDLRSVPPCDGQPVTETGALLCQV